MIVCSKCLTGTGQCRLMPLNLRKFACQLTSSWPQRVWKGGSGPHSSGKSLPHFLLICTGAMLRRSEIPKVPLESPQVTQTRPKATQSDPKVPPECPRTPQSDPQTAPQRPKSPPGVAQSDSHGTFHGASHSFPSSICMRARLNRYLRTWCGGICRKQ